ncbi:hypothetical protein ANN_21349 [Periplaneta americana]|uniref:EGF-like domain-containing protein n=1 Tax=Periplaneta americana TaxID=6978 RepID=A0ABQ8SGB9_PERAM|nr:hypothetical protein ANN_21349 [Periplaneta americana]
MLCAGLFYIDRGAHVHNVMSGNLRSLVSETSTCIDNQCQNPCTASRVPPCSADKTCDVLDHHPVCICTRNCNPSLSICLRDNGCPPQLACRGYRCMDPCVNVTCTDDAPCFVEEHKPVCKFCPPGFVTDSKYGCLKAGVSTSPSAPVTCTLDVECTDAQACISGECVDPCTNNCGLGSQCRVQAHKPICFCPQGYEGNPAIGCSPIGGYTITSPQDNLTTMTTYGETIETAGSVTTPSGKPTEVEHLTTLEYQVIPLLYQQSTELHLYKTTPGNKEYETTPGKIETAGPVTTLENQPK